MADPKFSCDPKLRYGLGEAEATCHEILDVGVNNIVAKPLCTSSSTLPSFFLVQARDLQALTAAGYELMSVVPFDLFPQTRHIESVATLQWPEPNAAPKPKVPKDLEAMVHGTEQMKKNPGRYARKKRR